MTLQEIISAALSEDIGDGDHTTLATIPPDTAGKARLIIKGHGILCGIPVAREVFRQVDPGLALNIYLHDGLTVAPGDVAFEVSGRKRSILLSERLVLNFLQRLSGIATATGRVTSQIRGLPARVLDTRKTTPLLRELEKYAVRTGGGENHRMGLYDMIMIKDNHVDYAGGIGRAIGCVREYLDATGKQLKIEIEVRNFKELEEVLSTGGVDRIMLDNFKPGPLKEAVKQIAGRFETEASGGITAENIREYAETGVDFISMGALTHQIASLDMSLKAL